MNIPKIPPQELDKRMKAIRKRMDQDNPDWELLLIVSKVNQFYFTGTQQNGILIIPREKEAGYWVKRSIERAKIESAFPSIHAMHSFRDAAASLDRLPHTIHLETERVPLAHFQRMNKHFQSKQNAAADLSIAAVRSVKSEYELDRMKKSGVIHRQIMEERIPQLLQEGMSEAEFAADLYQAMIADGHHGIARFAMYDTEILLGHICFGESSVYPMYFDGPGGNYGMSPAVPLLGSRERKLQKGDLVFVDIGCGYDGYHTDKTMTYMFQGSIDPKHQNLQRKLVEIEQRTAQMLKPGAIPSEIYASIIDGLDADLKENFMGMDGRSVNFLGHGIGLHVDEWPVIAKGFDEPLQENMVMAVEPKKAIAGFGVLGTENSFIVTASGGQSITGNNPGLIPI